ncbi:MAG: VanZ family protein [Armatimonadota bacterium]
MKYPVARWIPAGCWMALIYGASTDSGSVGHTRPVVTALLTRLFPEWVRRTEPTTLHAIDWSIRKCAHVTEYAILTLLVAFAIGRRTDSTRHLIWIVPLVYAITDEFHQSLVPSRYSSLLDVLVDMSGVALVLFVFRVRFGSVFRFGF